MIVVKSQKSDYQSKLCSMIARKHGIEFSHVKHQLEMGSKEELKHTSDKKIARKIAVDHLLEDPHYYTKLERMENMDVEDMAKAKYIKRIPKASGKGYTYIYSNKKNKTKKQEDSPEKTSSSDDIESMKKEASDIMTQIKGATSFPEVSAAMQDARDKFKDSTGKPLPVMEKLNREAKQSIVRLRAEREGVELKPLDESEEGKSYFNSVTDWVKADTTKTKEIRDAFMVEDGTLQGEKNPSNEIVRSIDANLKPIKEKELFRGTSNRDWLKVKPGEEIPTGIASFSKSIDVATDFVGGGGDNIILRYVSPPEGEGIDVHSVVKDTSLGNEWASRGADLKSYASEKEVAIRSKALKVKKISKEKLDDGNTYTIIDVNVVPASISKSLSDVPEMQSLIDDFNNPLLKDEGGVVEPEINEKQRKVVNKAVIKGGKLFIKSVKTKEDGETYAADKDGSLFSGKEATAYVKGSSDDRLEYFKKKLIEQMNKPLKKSIIMVKAKGYPVGTVREWRGREYKKMQDGKWKLNYKSGDTRGAKQARGNVIKKIQNAKSMDELVDIIKNNKERFKDSDGKPLPIVKELLSAARETEAGAKQKQAVKEKPKAIESVKPEFRSKVERIISSYRTRPVEELEGLKSGFNNDIGVSEKTLEALRSQKQDKDTKSSIEYYEDGIARKKAFVEGIDDIIKDKKEFEASVSKKEKISTKDAVKQAGMGKDRNLATNTTAMYFADRYNVLGDDSDMWSNGHIALFGSGYTDKLKEKSRKRFTKMFGRDSNENASNRATPNLEQIKPQNVSDEPLVITGIKPYSKDEGVKDGQTWESGAIKVEDSTYEYAIDSRYINFLNQTLGEGYTLHTNDKESDPQRGSVNARNSIAVKKDGEVVGVLMPYDYSGWHNNEWQDPGKGLVKSIILKSKNLLEGNAKEIYAPKAEDDDSYDLEGVKSWKGLTIDIENKKGSYREGKDQDGKPWKTLMNFDYGRIRGTKASDNESVDAYIGNDKDSDTIYVVHQNNPLNGVYDEDKCMLCFSSREDAIKGYESQYNRPGFLGDVSEFSVEDFKIALKERRGAMLYNSPMKRIIVRRQGV